jgi:hypothetical protein
MSSIVELLEVPLIDHRVPSLLVHNISLSHVLFFLGLSKFLRQAFPPGYLLIIHSSSFVPRTFDYYGRWLRFVIGYSGHYYHQLPPVQCETVTCCCCYNKVVTCIDSTKRTTTQIQRYQTKNGAITTTNNNNKKKRGVCCVPINIVSRSELVERSNIYK